MIHRDREKTIKFVSLEQFQIVAQNRGLDSATLSGHDFASGRMYQLTFVLKHPHSPFIRIDTEERDAFLARDTEQEAQDGLIALAKSTRSLTGGFFGIHPFWGSVIGTQLTQVAPGFGAGSARPNEALSMLIHLTDDGHHFDQRLTREAQAIGVSFDVPSPESRRNLVYMEALKQANPNQGDRDIAIINGLEREWTREFERFNNIVVDGPFSLTQSLVRAFQQHALRKPAPERVPQTIELTPANVVAVARGLERIGMRNFIVDQVNLAS